MKLKVMIPFKFRGAMTVRDQQIEADRPEAARLLYARVVSMVPAEQAVRPPVQKAEPPNPERAVRPPAERRGRKSKAKDVPDADHPTGD